MQMQGARGVPCVYAWKIYIFLADFYLPTINDTTMANKPPTTQPTTTIKGIHTRTHAHVVDLSKSKLYN